MTTPINSTDSDSSTPPLPSPPPLPQPVNERPVLPFSSFQLINDAFNRPATTRTPLTQMNRLFAPPIAHHYTEDCQTPGEVIISHCEKLIDGFLPDVAVSDWILEWILRHHKEISDPSTALQIICKLGLLVDCGRLPLYSINDSRAFDYLIAVMCSKGPYNTPEHALAFSNICSLFIHPSNLGILLQLNRGRILSTKETRELLFSTLFIRSPIQSLQPQMIYRIFDLLQELDRLNQLEDFSPEGTTVLASLIMTYRQAKQKDTTLPPLPLLTKIIPGLVDALIMGWKSGCDLLFVCSDWAFPGTILSSSAREKLINLFDSAPETYIETLDYYCSLLIIAKIDVINQKEIDHIKKCLRIGLQKMDENSASICDDLLKSLCHLYQYQRADNLKSLEPWIANLMEFAVEKCLYNFYRNRPGQIILKAIAEQRGFQPIHERVFIKIFNWWDTRWKELTNKPLDIIVDAFFFSGILIDLPIPNRCYNQIIEEFFTIARSQGIDPNLQMNATICALFRQIPMDRIKGNAIFKVIVSFPMLARGHLFTRFTPESVPHFQHMLCRFYEYLEDEQTINEDIDLSCQRVNFVVALSQLAEYGILPVWPKLSEKFGSCLTLIDYHLRTTYNEQQIELDPDLIFNTIQAMGSLARNNRLPALSSHAQIFCQEIIKIYIANYMHFCLASGDLTRFITVMQTLRWLFATEALEQHHKFSFLKEINPILAKVKPKIHSLNQKVTHQLLFDLHTLCLALSEIETAQLPYITSLMGALKAKLAHHENERAINAKIVKLGQ